MEDEEFVIFGVPAADYDGIDWYDEGERTWDEIEVNIRRSLEEGRAGLSRPISELFPPDASEE